MRNHYYERFTKGNHDLKRALCQLELDYGDIRRFPKDNYLKAFMNPRLIYRNSRNHIGCPLLDHNLCFKEAILTCPYHESKTDLMQEWLYENAYHLKCELLSVKFYNDKAVSLLITVKEEYKYFRWGFIKPGLLSHFAKTGVKRDEIIKLLTEI